ncbi:hypothetical protein D3C75_756440 [compost metagenome]
MPGGNHRQLQFIRQHFDFTACPKAPGHQHPCPLLQRKRVYILAVAHDQQAVRIDIPDHGVHLHRPDDILMKMLVQSVRTAQHMPLYDIHHIPKGQLVGDVAGFLFHPDRADPLFRNDDAEILRLLHRTVSRTLADTHFPGQLADGNFGSYLQAFNVLQQLFMFGNVIALTFQLLHPHAPICTTLYPLYTLGTQEHNSLAGHFDRHGLYCGQPHLLQGDYDFKRGSLRPKRTNQLHRP